jgi:hypothetical protein
MALRIGLGLFVGRRRAAGLDPIRQHRQQLVGKRLALPFGRHPHGWVERGHPLQDQARIRITLRHRPARLAPLEHQGHGVDPQSRLLLEAAMAGKAPLG